MPALCGHPPRGPSRRTCPPLRYASGVENPLAIRVWCLVADGVEAKPSLLKRLHELNATMALARLVLTDGAVFCAIDIPASPFRVEHLREALRGVRRVTSEVRPHVRECAPAATA